MLFFQFRFHLKILPSPAVTGAKLQIRGTSLVFAHSVQAGGRPVGFCGFAQMTA
jgi:hypothetical protein